jgi:hypothetical protein
VRCIFFALRRPAMSTTTTTTTTTTAFARSGGSLDRVGFAEINAPHQKNAQPFRKDKQKRALLYDRF